MMKRYIYHILVIALVLLVTSCDEKEDWEQINSSTMEVSGEYWVKYDHHVYGEDAFGVGYTKIIISNTAADNGTEIWLSDEGNFWDYKVKIPTNVEDLTFGSDQVVTNIVDGYDIQVRVSNGKIIPDAVSNLASGVTADSIYFEVWFEDLEGSTGIENDTLFVSGFRKTGFLEDEH
ncbi:hypothetical protein OU798_01175 [Prolixibacteraceae bacterium Z1-6]|uniref:Uncharacterized protein n=1 Tax=Draconibacterium aestuarii TaxID=2998507 RepID=A0A9X3J4K9_9BACT|nr:hypothetical protein [Prolixibacteraceae bacterium Z1-6]